MVEVSLASPRCSGINRSPIPPSPNLRIRHRKGKVENKKNLVGKLLVSNVDALVSRGCSLQLAKMGAKQNIVLCAARANPCVEWMLRSHNV
eukprot:13775184-Ditylum_brightwellii.AAC.1